MKKTYRSCGGVALTINVNGTYKRIDFMPTTNNGSYYSTDDEAEQKVIESNAWFGKKYYLFTTEETKKEVKPEQKSEAIVTETPSVEEEGKVMNFDSAAEAKAYLMETFGATATSVKTIAKIVDYGKSKGINIIIG